MWISKEQITMKLPEENVWTHRNTQLHITNNKNTWIMLSLKPKKREQHIVITGKSENDVHNKQKLVKNKKT